MGRKLVSPTTYWRRRVVILAVGMAALGLPLWAVNQALGGSQAPGPGSLRSHAGPVAGAAARAGTAGGPRQPLAGDTPHPRTGPLAYPQPSASSPSANTARSHRRGRRACAVLTLRSTRYRYRPGEPVTFVVGAASTTSRPCRVNLGSRFTSVVVASGGTPLWDSSSCPRGAGARVVMVRRGSPAFLRVTWDRRTSLSGCPRQGRAVRPGTYTAAAYSGRVHSRTKTFILSSQAAP